MFPARPPCGRPATRPAPRRTRQSRGLADRGRIHGHPVRFGLSRPACRADPSPCPGLGRHSNSGGTPWHRSLRPRACLHGTKPALAAGACIASGALPDGARVPPGGHAAFHTSALGDGRAPPWHFGTGLPGYRVLRVPAVYRSARGILHTESWSRWSKSAVSAQALGVAQHPNPHAPRP